jgi:PhnB protein
MTMSLDERPMPMPVKPIPAGYHSVTPYLTVKGAAKIMEFLKQAFGAEPVNEPIKRPDGAIMHAEVTIGDSRVMIADESEHAKATPCALYLYVPDVDATYRQAVKAGPDGHGTHGYVLGRSRRLREGPFRQ